MRHSPLPALPLTRHAYDKNSWEHVKRRLAPRKAELEAMLSDLSAIFEQRELSLMFNVKPPVLYRWREGKIGVAGPSLKLIWLTWVVICRPGAVQTVFDLATFGRFTPLGGPEHAGKPPLQAIARHIEGGQYARMQRLAGQRKQRSSVSASRKRRSKSA